MSKTDWSDAKRARVEAARRPRRIIFNDDTHELALEDADTPEGFLGHRITPLAETQVGTISWSVLCGQFDAPAYDSKVQPIYGDAHGGPVKYWRNVTENVKALARKYRCPLHLVTDFAHAHDMEAFASVRMNDVHDSFIKGWLSTWKKEHPELLVDTKGRSLTKLYVTAKDFTHEQCRSRKIEIIEEVARRYDIDGFELDYIRHPLLFSRTMRSLPVTAEEVQIMTSFHQRTRQIADQAGARRGRPILLAVRVPDSLKLSMNIGLDVKTWLKKDLVDIIIAGGGYAPFTLPVEEFVQVAHQYDVPVYPCINREAPLTSYTSNHPVTEGIRALAANWYQAGADGIYFWNLGTPFADRTGYDLIRMRQRYYACLKEIGDPKMLIGKDKLFCVDDWLLSYYTHISSRHPLPLTLRPGVSQRVPFVVGDDIEAAAKSGLLAQMKLWIKVRGPARKDALVFRLNGEELKGAAFVRTYARRSEYQINYVVTAPPLKRGRNVLEGLIRDGGASMEVRGIRLKVEYKADR